MPIIRLGEVSSDFVVGNESAMLSKAMVISSQTPTPVALLALPIEAENAYVYHADIFYRSYDVANGIGLSMDGPAGFAYLKTSILLDDSRGDKNNLDSEIIEEYNSIRQGVGVGEVSKLYSGVISVVLVNGSHAGFLTIMANTEIEGSVALIDMGSHCYVRRAELIG